MRAVPPKGGRELTEAGKVPPCAANHSSAESRYRLWDGSCHVRDDPGMSPNRPGNEYRSAPEQVVQQLFAKIPLEARPVMQRQFSGALSKVGYRQAAVEERDLIAEHTNPTHRSAADRRIQVDA